MIQISRTLKNNLDITDFLSEIKGYPTERSLLFLFEESIDEQNTLEILRKIQKDLPCLTVVGATAYNRDNYFDRMMNPSNLIMSFLSFEESGFEIITTDLDRSTEWQAAMNTKLHLADIPDVKGIFLLTAGIETKKEILLKKINQFTPEIPIFGMGAAADEAYNSSYPSFLFCNDNFYHHAALCIAFHGKRLCIQANTEFGWTPLGRKMTVTGTAPGNVVVEIDGQPAANVYKHYLGLDLNQINIPNTCEFPIFRKQGKIFTPRISLEAFEDGSVRFGAPLSPGDEINFSYGYPPDILRSAEQSARHLSSFKPQALFLIICMNRVIFLQNEWEKEYEPFRQLLNDTIAIHGHSELFMDVRGGGELNSAMVIAAMREGYPEEDNNSEQLSIDTAITNEVIPLERRLLNFLDSTTKELEELQENLEEEVKRQTEEIRRQQNALNQANIHIVMTLSNAIDAKDAYTNGHSMRVARYAAEIARRAGYNEHRQNNVYMIGLLHDIGKIGIPDAIINKPGKLTDEEFAEIKKHPAIGAEILSAITELPLIAYGAHWHHERWDGRGYPDGLKGEEIPEIAQIISVADAYDAMTSTRSYRAVMPQEKVRSEIDKGRGTQFAPRFAEIMLEMIDEDRDYQMRGNLLSA